MIRVDRSRVPRPAILDLVNSPVQKEIAQAKDLLGRPDWKSEIRIRRNTANRSGKKSRVSFLTNALLLYTREYRVFG